MYKKVISNYHKISLIIFFMMGLLSCTPGNDENALDKVLKSGEPFFSILYTKGFSKRFSLPPNKAIRLQEHLQAIAVEFNRINFRYSCTLHLYVDDNLDIYVPESENYFSLKPAAEYFFVNEYSDADLTYNGYTELNMMRIKILSSPSAKYPFTETLSYSRVHKSFLPGVTLLSIDTSCYDFDSDKYPADIWVQKENVGDYLLGNDGPAEVKQEEKNYRFSIPNPLIDQIKPYIKLAVDHNDKFLSSN